MSSTLIVGIDVNSQSNSVFFMDSEGTCLLKKAFFVHNDTRGALKLTLYKVYQKPH